MVLVVKINFEGRNSLARGPFYGDSQCHLTNWPIIIHSFEGVVSLSVFLADGHATF